MTRRRVPAEPSHVRVVLIVFRVIRVAHNAFARKVIGDAVITNGIDGDCKRGLEILCPAREKKNARTYGSCK